MSLPSPTISPHHSPTTTHSNAYHNPFPDLNLPATTNPPSRENPPKPSVWLIFGATGQIGRFIVDSALKHGDSVCAVGRSQEDDLNTIQKWHHDNKIDSPFMGLLCDIRIRDSVNQVIAQTMTRFHQIDIIANCAGYGVIGSCEDQDEYEIRNQFETNFMGTLNIIQLSLPYFRERTSGRYLIFSSTSGALGVPGIGPFCATKYAVEGLVESMLYEVDGFNIKLTLVQPGHVRRDDLHDEDENTSPQKKIPLFNHFKIAKQSEPYSNKDSPANNYKRIIQWVGDHAPTSAARAAELVWQLGHCSYPPLRLLLGTYAVESVRDRLKSIIEEIEDWKHLHFPPVEGQDGDVDLDHDHDHERDGEHEDEEDGDVDNDHDGNGEHEEDYDRDQQQKYKNSSKAAHKEDVNMQDS